MSSIKDNLDVELVEEVTYGSTIASDPIDPAVAKRLKLKLDLIILPTLAVIYFLASMSRSDLGNAKSMGMSAELHLSAHQYSNLASAFLIGYILFQLPGTIFLRKIGAPLQLAIAMVCWGTCVSASSAAKTYGQLFALRFLVGAAEAFVQGVVFYLSFWYTYQELVFRGSIFFAASSLAGGFNGLIAYAVYLTLQGKHGLQAWQWLFIIEGLLSVGVGLMVVFILPRTPELSPRWFLSEEEKKVAIQRSRDTHNAADAKLRYHLLYKPLVEVKWWMLAAMYAGSHYAGSSLSNFLPPIIEGFGYSIAKTQLMTVIVYACALVSTLSFGYLADKTQKRGIYVIICALVAIIGYILLLTLRDHRARLAGACIVIMGVFPTIPVILTWSLLSIAGYTKRAASVAMINVVSQLFAISGNQAYNDPPLYRHGNASALGLSAFMGVSALAMIWWLNRLNVKKANLKASLSEDELNRLRQQSLDIVGDDHVDYVYKF